MGKRGKKPQKATRAHVEAPQRHKERPTVERMARGKWRLGETIDAGIKVAIDDAAHPLEALRHDGLISAEQYEAGCDYEALYRSQCEVPGSRDSTTIWEPKGYASDDGPIEERERYKALCRAIGMLCERRLWWVCVDHRMPRKHEVGQLREDLNEAWRFFDRGAKKRLHPFPNYAIS